MTALLIFILWCLATIGATIIVTQSTIFKPVRSHFKPESKWGQLLSCPLCLGFHMGWIMRMLFIERFGNDMLGYGFYLRGLTTLEHWCTFASDLFIFACAGSILSMLAYLVMIKLGFDKT